LVLLHVLLLLFDWSETFSDVDDMPGEPGLMILLQMFGAENDFEEVIVVRNATTKNAVVLFMLNW
jgi:hypothetical protein